MLRRTFLKMFGSASIAFAVGVHHFKPVPDEILLPLPKGKEEITRGLSPVLEAVRKWNDERWQAGGVVWDEGCDFVPIKQGRVRMTTKRDKIDWRTRWAQEMAISSEEYERLADNSRASLPGDTLPEPVGGRGPVQISAPRPMRGGMF